jgi:hypothetical protein
MQPDFEAETFVEKNSSDFKHYFPRNILQAMNMRTKQKLIFETLIITDQQNANICMQQQTKWGLNANGGLENC